MTLETFALYGTHEAEEQPVTLSAGRLSADLANGNLRAIRYNGIEVLRAVSYLLPFAMPPIAPALMEARSPSPCELPPRKPN